MPSIFMDRDGVINQNIDGGYVTQWDEFCWLTDAIKAITLLASRHWQIFIVTNQACVGKGIISLQQLNLIHEQMLNEISLAGATITKVYACTHLPEQNCGCRKPKPGMLEQAAREFNLDLSTGIMIGDALTDMEAAKEVGCYSILVRTGRGQRYENDSDIKKWADHVSNNLYEAVLHVLNREEHHHEQLY